MISITNDVTFIEASEEANALTITGGEKYHTHTRAVTSILQLVDKKVNFIFSFISPETDANEGKIQFKIEGANNPIIESLDEEFLIYQHFAKNLQVLLQDTEHYHRLVSNEDDDDAKELNQASGFKLGKIALELSKIERDLVLAFNTQAGKAINDISVKKLKKLPELKELAKHEKRNILIDEFAKHNKSGSITVTLKDVTTLELLGSKITIREHLIDEVLQAYSDATAVDVIVLNKDKITPNKCKLTGEIIEITESQTLFSSEDF
jgi:hypothetical protein